jgi:hypothetical protein
MPHCTRRQNEACRDLMLLEPELVGHAEREGA